MAIPIRFRNRSHAGGLLAKELTDYAYQSDVVVLGLPRGGVPVAFEIANALHAPLDVFVVRKLGLPGHEELAMGAIASGGARVLNRDVIRAVEVSSLDLAAVTSIETRELERREHLYRGGVPFIDVKDKTVILVDDGIATGSTMAVAVNALRSDEPRAIVVAAPVASVDAAELLSRLADDSAFVQVPPYFASVGAWYLDFTPTEDDEVRNLLRRSRGIPNGVSTVATA
ncbi:MAG TPA: phosphoribosyltransferase [Gemmatimonadaceae bacterium]|nr:phosphoribosyltransferase [Gemmatimonadaceae bacterium]